MAWWRKNDGGGSRWICPYEGCDDYILYNPKINLPEAIYNHVLYLHPVDFNPQMSMLLTADMRREVVEFNLQEQLDQLMKEMGQM